MFTRKHYKAIADMVENNSQEFTGLNGLVTVNMVRARFCNDLADYFAADNPSFDRAQFLSACSIEDGDCDIDSYDVQDAIDAGFTLEPLKCRHCDIIGETTYSERVGDAYCASCGKWQRD